PSDLEQMPHLLNFVTGNGTLLTQHHTPLIAHTGTNFVSSLTGVYPDRHGANVSNGFRYFNADGSSSSSTMFAYWTGRVVDVAPQVSPGAPLQDLNGNVIQDSSGRAGFPGFDGLSAPVSLGYAAAMQEHGVPVTFSYISDAHDSHTRHTAMGPGEAEYVQVL